MEKYFNVTLPVQDVPLANYLHHNYWSLLVFAYAGQVVKMKMDVLWLFGLCNILQHTTFCGKEYF